MQQLSIFSELRPLSDRLEGNLQASVPLPHQIRVPFSVASCPERARELAGIITRLYQATHDPSCFGRFCEIVWATLRRSWPTGERDYLRLTEGLNEEVFQILAEGFALLVEHFWVEGSLYDVLGAAYMLLRSEWAGTVLGQYFTPWSLCRFTARMTMQGVDVDRLRTGPAITVCDPACGSGALLLATKAAVAEITADQFDDPRRPMRMLKCYGQDIDFTCTVMARIQLQMSDDRWMSSYMLAQNHDILSSFQD